MKAVRWITTSPSRTHCGSYYLIIGHFRDKHSWRPCEVLVMCLKGLYSHGSFYSTSPLGCRTQSWHFQCECKLPCLERPRSLANKPGVSHEAEVRGISVPDSAWGMGKCPPSLPPPPSPRLPLSLIALSALPTNSSYLCPGNETLTFKAGYCSFSREMYF